MGAGGAAAANPAAANAATNAATNAAATTTAPAAVTTTAPTLRKHPVRLLICQRVALMR
jgi:hypothetical protein